MEVVTNRFDNFSFTEYLKKIHFDLVKEKKSSKLEYLNISSSFDIETSSFYDGDNKVGLMYLWVFGINSNRIVYGRTWQEFELLIEILYKTLHLDKYFRLIVYVHNLDFEFQFMRKHFKWDKVFAIDNRKVVMCLYKGIEFRCSYILSALSLSKVAENLQFHKIKKLVGDLDYKKIRHSNTIMTDDEMQYAYNDVLIVMYYIDEKIKSDGNIAKIPLTNTGYVRRYCRKNCFYGDNKNLRNYVYCEYKKLMQELVLDSEEYLQLKRAFQGGFTHANAYRVGAINENIASYDFTSAYPACLVAEKFPMSKSEIIAPLTIEELEFNFENYCCVFDISFINIESKVIYEHYISKSKCFNYEKLSEENGRVIRADYLEMTITELDYLIIKDMYEWEGLRIGVCRRYKKDYLPTNFVKSILKLYKDKTELKGVDDKQEEYFKSKGMLNSCYGMTVTDIIRDNLKYDSEIHEWSESIEEIKKSIDKNNKSINRFLFYAWGVYDTAYNRYNLFSAIKECELDYVYSDTDSVKILNYEKHKEYFEKYNKNNLEKMKRACKQHNIDFELIQPKTIKGKTKTLGEWDFEGVYKKFKTLGAKRYMFEQNGMIEFTISGVNKKFGMPYLLEKYKDKVFDAFNDNMTIPKGYTGKLTHTYIDDERKGKIKDYQGVEFEYKELSATHLEECEFSLSMASNYVDYLNFIKGD